MAIFSAAISSIGKSKQAQPYTASAHIDYITEATEKGQRQVETCTEILAARMPLDPIAAMEWMDDQEDNDRKNARMIDKVRLALPVELTHDQNAALVRDFCERVTRGKVPWLAAIHDNPEVETNEQGQYNPHAHIVIRDRDEDGKRVLCTSDDIRASRRSGKPVPEFYNGHETVADYFRAMWEEAANDHLEMAGSDARIDRRSLKDQGIDREAQIHVGVAAAQMCERGAKPETDPGYLEFIDSDHTRLEANAARIARNLENEAQQFARERAASVIEAEEADKPRPTGPLHMEQHGAWPQQWEDRPGMAAQQGEAMKWLRDEQAPGHDPNRQWTEIRPSRPDIDLDPHTGREARAEEPPPETPREAREAKTEQTAAHVEKQAKRERSEKAVDDAWTDWIIAKRSDRSMDDDGGMEM